MIVHNTPHSGAAVSQQQTRVGSDPAAATCCCSHDEIAKRAYGIYEQSGRQSGHCDANWKQAEKDLAVTGQTKVAVQTMQNEGGPPAPEKPAQVQSYSTRATVGARS